MTQLETERLLLRKPERSDLDGYMSVFGDPKVTRFLGHGGARSREEVSASLDRMLLHWDRHEIGLFSVVRTADEQLLGRVGFLLWDEERWVNAMHEDPQTETELGWTLARALEPGYATEARSPAATGARERGLTRLSFRHERDPRPARRTAGLAADYVETLGERPVFPDVTPEELREALGGPLPDDPVDAAAGGRRARRPRPSRASSRMGSGRYFGFVIGGALPAALAADWLTSTWDQNAGLYVGGPSASVVEQVAREWLVDLLGLPADSSVGFVTGTQMAHVTGLAAARFARARRGRLGRRRDGLNGAPRVRVLVGEQRHVTVDRALRLLGLGAPTVVLATRRDGCVPDALREALAARRPDDRLRPGRRGEHRRVRPAPGDRRRLRGRRRLAPRRRRLRDLGRRLAALAAPRRGRRARRLVDDRRAQVAERSLRLGDRALRAPRVAPRGDDDRGLVPDPGRGRAARPRPGRLGAGVLAPRARASRLRGAALARAQRPGRAGRALLRRGRHDSPSESSSSPASSC